MAQQLQRDEAMHAAPGPALGRWPRLAQRPLRLHEFIEDRLAAAKPFNTYAGTDALISTDGRSLLIRIAGTQAAE